MSGDPSPRQSCPAARRRSGAGLGRPARERPSQVRSPNTTLGTSRTARSLARTAWRSAPRKSTLGADPTLSGSRSGYRGAPSPYPRLPNPAHPLPGVVVARPRHPHSRQGLSPAATDPTRVQDAPSPEDTLLTPPARCTQEFGDSTALKLFGFKLTQSGRCEKRERRRSIYTFSTREGGDARQSGVPCARGRPAPQSSAGHGGGAPAHPAPHPARCSPSRDANRGPHPPHGGQPPIRAPGARPPGPGSGPARPRGLPPPTRPAKFPAGAVRAGRPRRRTSGPPARCSPCGRALSLGLLELTARRPRCSVSASPGRPAAQDTS